MEFRKTIIVLLLAIFLFSITSVCASEIDDPIASEDTNQIGLSDSDKAIEDNLQTSEENPTLTVEENDETLSSETDSEILTADQFTYSDLKRQISQGGNINLTKGTYTYNQNDGDTIEIIDSGVINGNGAVIDMAQSGHRAFNVTTSGVTIKNLTIKNANYNGDGGAIYFSSSGTVTNCNFINNFATSGGAVWISAGSIENSNFTNNNASKDGGAVHFKNNATVVNCNFANNEANYCGAIRIDSGSIENCNFTNNNANKNGGAVWINSGEVTNCNFADNKATGNEGYGGAVYFNSNGTVTNCNFTGNNATIHGGAVWIPTGSIENSNFTNNNASKDGGAVHFKNNATVVNCNFANNEANYCGAIRIDSGSIENCNFTNNNANKNGGAVWINSGEVTNCNFADNKATGNEGYGGAVYFNSSGNVTNCNFTGNNATIHGGAVWIPTGSIENSNFTNNNASKDGGAVYFKNNATVVNCNFANNEANYCGAIRIDSGSIENCNFTNNNASKNGGAVYFNSNGTMTNCNFADNRASYGGAVYFNDEGNVTDCNFTANKASLSGGAAYFQSNANVENCNFTGNNAKNGGAILSSPMCYAIVAGCLFTGNSAFNGGAVNLYSGSIEDCDFTSNSATNAGGAAVFSEGGRLAYCNFEANTASKGGAVSMFTGNVENCNFTGNNATMGSAINCNGFSHTNISNSCFLNNRANASADDSFNVTVNGNTLEIAFMGQNNLLNAIYSNGNINFTNVTYWGFNGITKTGDDSIVMSPSNCEAGQNISIAGVVNGNILKTTQLTDENGKIVLENSIYYYLVLRHDGNSYYTEAEKTISNMRYNVNVTSQTTTNRTVNITAKSNIYSEVMPGKLLFILPNGDEINATYATGGIWWAVHTFDEYGDYQVNASYIGLDNVTIQDATISITKANSTVNLRNVVLNYGESTNVTVTTEGATGITAKINDNPVTVINNYTIPISGLDVGTYTLTVTTIPDADHYEVTRTVNITVTKANPEIMMNVTLEGDTAIIDVTAPEDVANPVVVDVDEVGYYVNITYGKGQLILPSMAGGLHNVTARYLGDDNYNQSEPQSKSFEICNISSVVSVKVDNITYGDKAVIEVTVPADASGNVTVTIDGKEYIENVSCAKAIFIVAGLGAGNYTVDVTYNGDEKYASSDNSTVLKVCPIKIDERDIFVVDQGNGTVVVVVFKNAGGNITVKVGEHAYNSTLADGRAVINLDNETPGTHDVDVIYWGDENHEGNFTASTITIPKFESPISVDVQYIEYGKQGIVIITLPENATGNVSIEIEGVRYDSEEIHDGVVEFSIKNLTAGSKTIAVDYAGDDNYIGNHTTANITVTKANPEIMMIVTLDGDTAVIDVTAPEDVVNPVLVDVDGVGYYVNITGGKGQLVLPSMAGGWHSVTAKYPGDDRYNQSEPQSKSFEICNISSVVSVKVDNITYGDKAVIEVTVPADATGNVTVTIDGKDYIENVSCAKAIFIVAGLGAGNYTVDVTYDGDEKYASSKTSAELEVSKAKTFIKVIDMGNGTVIVVVSDNVSSDVTIKVGNNSYGVAVEDGIAMIDLVNETCGVHDIEVICDGDENHTAAYANASITLNKFKTLIIANAITTTYNVNKDLVISLIDVKGNPISGAKIAVDLNGVKTYTTDEKGNIKVSTKGLAPNTYTASITFDGNDNYEKSMGSVKVSVKKATPKITAKKKTFKVKTKTKKYSITLKDNAGKAMKKVKVTLKVKGKTYKATTNSKGKATFKIKNLNKKGKYTAAIKYNGDKNYNKVTKKVKLTVKSNKKKKSTFKTLSKGSKDKATIKKIQRALKNKGYYLTYKGQYLKIDGIYHGHTERSVKEFQHDKGLKVTGKVDKKTAIKLGII